MRFRNLDTHRKSAVRRGSRVNDPRRQLDERMRELLELLDGISYERTMPHPSKK